MSSLDNGGAIAIKGFNYQKASIMLIMINNYQKDNFMIIPEARDDFEVRYDDKTIFIQVKGTKKLSVTNLIKQNKGKKSVLEKNLIVGKNSDIRKVFLWDMIDSDKEKLEEEENSRITSPIYKFSKEQQEIIKSKLNLSQNQIKRLNNQFIFITPFENNNETTITFLKGEMVNKDLMMSNKSAQNVLGELVLQIDQKSEISINNTFDFEKKIISGNYLKEIFTTVHQMDDFNEVLDTLSMNTMKKKKIRLEKLKIPIIFKNVKGIVKDNISAEILFDLTNIEALDLIIEVAKKENRGMNDEQLWALAIECYCELGDEANEN